MLCINDCSLCLLAESRALLPHTARVEHNMREGRDALRGGAGERRRARLHLGGDQLPSVRVHLHQPAGRLAGTLHRARLQVTEHFTKYSICSYASLANTFHSFLSLLICLLFIHTT